MAISPDEAIVKAREFVEKSAETLGLFTLSEDLRESSRLIPSLWRIHFVGDYQDFEIDVDTETGEIFNWDCLSPMQIGIKKAAERISRAEEEGKPLEMIRTSLRLWTRKRLRLIRNGRRGKNISLEMWLERKLRTRKVRTSHSLQGHYLHRIGVVKL